MPLLPSRSRRLGRLGATLTTLGLVTALALAPPAAAADDDGISPPGANDWSCKPSRKHPFPVILVPGTFESMAKNWSTLSPYLAARGYCVFALDYGETHGVQATGPVAESAVELKRFVRQVRRATGARQVDLVGHSQGGMMPRYYMHFLGGADRVHHLIGIAPSNHGTTSPLVPPPTFPFTETCQACLDQAAGSPFMTELNAPGDTVRGPFYTVISTVYDEVVTPYTSQALAGPKRRVTNLVIQDYCPLDPIEHDQAPNDPVVHRMVRAALADESGPADPTYRPRCL